jgi:hypothetical protein
MRSPMKPSASADGSLPLLTPMSEVAGRMAVQVGAQYLEAPMGGRGILLGGVPGRGSGERGDSGRRRGRPQRGENGGRPGRARHHHRPQSEPAARAGRHLFSQVVTLASNATPSANRCATPTW